VIALRSGRVLLLYGVVFGWAVLALLLVFDPLGATTDLLALDAATNFSKDTRKVVYVHKITKTKLVVQ